MEGKRKKMQQAGPGGKRKGKVTDGLSDSSGDHGEAETGLTREKIINTEISSIRPITRDMQVIQTFVSDPWLEAEDKAPSDWSFSYSTRSKCRLFTFKDLWNHNFTLTEGSKFGGDFLVRLIRLRLLSSSDFFSLKVYCGDPVMYHAKYIVICLEDRTDIWDERRVQDLVARSRLGSSVKKIVLFSWLQGEEVKYKSLTRGSLIKI